jgi:hypothetical protein
VRKLLAVALLLCNAACRPRPLSPPDPCQAGGPSVLELRDGQGALLLAWKADREGRATLCGGNQRPAGVLRCDEIGDPRVPSPEGKNQRCLLLDERGEPRDTLESGPAGVALVTPERKLHVYRDERQLRLLDEQGVPLGSIAEQGGRTTLFSPAGAALGWEERASADHADDRRAVRDPDGAVRFFVLGAQSDRAAAAFGFPSLTPAEKALLARAIDTTESRVPQK